MTDISPELHSYDVRDPAQLIHDIAAQVDSSPERLTWRWCMT